MPSGCVRVCALLGMENGVHTKHMEEGANLTITEPGEIVRIYFGLS